MDDAAGTIDALRQACESARTQLGPTCSFRLRTLIGMILLEIDGSRGIRREAAGAEADRRPD